MEVRKEWNAVEYVNDEEKENESCDNWLVYEVFTNFFKATHKRNNISVLFGFLLFSSHLTPIITFKSF